MAQPQREGGVIEGEMVGYEPLEHSIDGIHDDEVLAQLSAACCPLTLERHCAMKGRSDGAQSKRSGEIGKTYPGFFGSEFEDERGGALQNGGFGLFTYRQIGEFG